MNSSQISAFIQEHRKPIGLILSGLFIFLAGIHIGRLTSPYSTAHPIIFEDRMCDGEACSGGSLTQLKELREEGIESRPAAKTNTSAQVAGTTQAQGQFVASVNSDLFHHITCSSVSRIKEENKVWFSTPEEARSAGYEASTCAKEKGY